MSLQWGDSRKSFALAGETPAPKQFTLVQRQPRLHQPHRRGRESTVSDAADDLDGNLVVPALRMQVGWRVLTVEHADDDPVKA